MLEAPEVFAFSGARVITPDNSADVDRVQIVAVHDRRWREGSAARRAPDDEVVGFLIGLERDVARRGGTNREDRLIAVVAAHHEDQSVSEDGRWRDDAGWSRKAPQLLAGGWIVAPCTLAAVGDDQRSSGRFVDDGRAERRAAVLVARRAPAFFACREIEGGDEARRTVALWFAAEIRVGLNDHEITMNGGRTAKAVTRVADHAEVFLPDRITVEVVAVQALGAERDDDSLPVGGRCSGSKGALEMPAQPGRTFIYGPFPDDPASRLIEAQQLPCLLGAIVRGAVAAHTA